MELCTIFLRCEEARVRALARSYAEHHPGSRCTALLIDGDAAEIDTGGEFEVIGRDDLVLPDGDVVFALLDEYLLRPALIPLLLDSVLERGGTALYADPNIRVYGPLEALGAQAEQHGWALLPTLASAPLEREGQLLEDLVQSRGAFDDSLLAVSPDPDVRAALRWWADQATRNPAPRAGNQALAISWWWDFEEGTIPDIPPNANAQRPHWLDLAAGLTGDFAVIRDPGVCARARELAAPELSQEGDAILVDGSPLRCFNFRGYYTAQPFRFGDVDLEHAEPALRRLCHEYAQELESLGDSELRRIPYGLSSMPDGTPLDGRMRKLYWEALRTGQVRGSVFTERGNREFVNWVREPGLPAGPAVLNRYVMQLYKERPDLQQAMPYTDRRFAERLGSWLVQAPEVTLPEQVAPDALRPLLAPDSQPSGNGEAPAAPAAPAAPPAPAEPPPRPRWAANLAPSMLAPADSWGVNVVGFMRSDFGIAHAARLVIEALDAQRIPLLPIHDLRLARFKTEGSTIATLGAEAAKFPITLLVMNGDALNELREKGGHGLLGKNYTIALWFWETDRIPEEWTESLHLIDELWVASDYVGEAIARRSSIPINKIHLPVRVPPTEPADRAELGIPEDDYLFMYAFDYGSIGARKNPLGLVRAFRQAFEPGEGASLLLKSSYSFISRNEYAAVRAAAEGHPDIYMLEERLPTEEKNALLAACDCYVSLHRSEGFGLSQAEAMYLGKPVIMTGYGGVLEFGNEENSYLVGYDEVEVGPDRSPYGEHDRWAEPRVDEAAKLMRHVFENREEAERVGARAAADIRLHHSAEAAGTTLEQRLVRIRRMLRAEIPAADQASPTPPEEAPAPAPVLAPPGIRGLWPRLRAKLRLRTRVRAFRARRAARAAGKRQTEMDVWKREQELRLAALSSQLLGHLRDLERRVSRAEEKRDD